MWKKRLQNLYAEIVLISMMQTTLSQQYYFKNLINDSTIDRIVDKTFEEIDSFLNWELSLKILNNKNRACFAIFFSKCVNI